MITEGAQLERLWSRAMRRRAGIADPAEDAAEWGRDNTVLRAFGLGLRETIAYLFAEAPAFEDFERWVLQHGGGFDSGAAARPAADEPGLTPAELAFFDEHGYVVLHDAVPAVQCRAAEDAIWEFLGMDRDDPATWYSGPYSGSIRVPLLRHPALWANRRSPRIRRAFGQLWQRDDLWMTVDDAGFNPPEHRNWRFPGPHLHWDADLAAPMPFNLSGILYLTDTAPEQGAFTCVPGFHRRLESWLATLPAGADPQRQDLRALGAVPIGGRAGDLVIWHHALPHGSSPNRDAPAHRAIPHDEPHRTGIWPDVPQRVMSVGVNDEKLAGNLPDGKMHVSIAALNFTVPLPMVANRSVPWRMKTAPSCTSAFAASFASSCEDTM